MVTQDAQKRSNQHIKRRERAHDIEFARRKIKAGILIARLNRAAAGKTELSKSQLEATKMLLDKAVPSLQAVETSQANPWDSVSDEDMREQVKALITSQVPLLLAVLDADPGLRAAVLAHITQKPALVEHTNSTIAA